MAIKKIEYKDAVTSGNVAYAFEESGVVVTATDRNIDLRYLDDFSYLSDPLNGWMDENGDPTNKLISKLKEVERINEATWEFVVVDKTRMDRRPLRGGKTRAIPTYYDKSGEASQLITGIGDLDDGLLLKIDQERHPDIMSRDLFISNFPGYVTGSSGSVPEIDYTNILNPVNQRNVNNYYPIMNHGYMYSGLTEYFMYGNKLTEIFPENGFIYTDSDGYRYYQISGNPNPISPIVCNFVPYSIEDILRNINLGGWSPLKRNSYREEYNGEEDEVIHDLNTSIPIVYIFDSSTNNLVIPDVQIQTLDQVRVTTPVVITGYTNIIRPNKKIRQYDVSDEENTTIVHSLNSTNIFAIASIAGILTIPDITVIDANSISVSIGGTGIMLVMAVDEYSHGEPVSAFSSGTIYHGLGIGSIEDETYVDPWVFGIETSTNNIVLPSLITVIDEDNLNISFPSPFTGVIRIINFEKLNEYEAVIDGINITTDNFAFSDEQFYGNEGLASPFHRTHPLPDNQFVLVGACSINEVKEDDHIFISGFSSEPTRPSYPIYLAPSGQLVVPPSISGTVFVHYESLRNEAFAFRFREIDCSPISWYNRDRILAIQMEQSVPDNLALIPDRLGINIQSGATLAINGLVDEQPIVYSQSGIVSGPPVHAMNLTSFVTDDAGVAMSGQAVILSTKRRLYYTSSGSLIDNYIIDPIDNTQDLFAIPSGILAELTSGTIISPSLFDRITLSGLVTSEFPIFDDNGYLFTTVSGQTAYRVPFLHGIFDEENDQFVHELQVETNGFGTALFQIGFHNDERNKKIKNAWIFGAISGTTIEAHTKIKVFPPERDVAVNYGYPEEPVSYVSTIETTSEHFTVVTDDLESVDNVWMTDRDTFQIQSGIIYRGEQSGSTINDVFQIKGAYLIYHGSIISGEVGYDTNDGFPALLNIGEYYGDN